VDILKVELLSNTPNPEELIEKAGRVCYQSETKTEKIRRVFIQNIIRRGHTSVLEHASASFLVDGISRACSHQLVRHRIGFSFSQTSQRYVKVENLTENYVIPESIKFSPEALERMDDVIEFIGNQYEYLTHDLGVPKEDARYILPNATFTSIMVTANFRAWRNFLELRCDKHAQKEIRDMAQIILQHLNSIAPIVFGDLYKKYAI